MLEDISWREVEHLDPCSHVLSLGWDKNQGLLVIACYCKNRIWVGIIWLHDLNANWEKKEVSWSISGSSSSYC